MDDTWIIIDKYFRDNPEFLVKHHLSSYNLFFTKELQHILREKNPIKIMKEQNMETHEFHLRGSMFIGGREGSKIYFGKPIVYDDKRSHFLYPNEARLRNLTYGFTIHVDVDVEIVEINAAGEKEEKNFTLSNILLGRFPIMLQSELCVLHGLTSQLRFNMGECMNDPGGYFIIDGKEKVIMSQEKFADNMLYVRDNYSDIYKYSAEIRSASEDTSKHVRTAAVRMVSPTPTASNGQIVVLIPNVRKPIPLFITMRALGLASDKDIIEYCLLNLEKQASFIELFAPSVHDAGMVFTQELALKYISTFTKAKTIPAVLDILSNYFLPHIGELNFRCKAYYVGYMVFSMLNVATGIQQPTARDSFKYKRIDLSGTLLRSLFKEYYTLQQKHLTQSLDKKYFYHIGTYQKNFVSLFTDNYVELFKERIVEKGFRKAFKGSWGSEPHTQVSGVVQDLNRLTFNSAISQLRKCVLPLDASAKVIGPRLLDGTQWGLIDPVDTPDGGNVGLHKHYAISTLISDGFSKHGIISLLREHNMLLLQECTPTMLSGMTKVFVNGDWCGGVATPDTLVKQLKFYRRAGLIPMLTSIGWNIEETTLYIFTDAGRPSRPVFYVDEKDKKISYERPNVLKKIKANEFTWQQLVSGFLVKKEGYTLASNNIYRYNELYDTTKSPSAFADDLMQHLGVVDYVDTAEEESCLIALEKEDFAKTFYTHVEIHGSFLYGVMGNQIIFPENNPSPRDVFSCGQAKQAVSLYSTNYQNRIDKSGIVLNYGQTPLVKSRYTKYINKEQNPYGVNAIVAIMSYGGYNTEDAILFNKGSIDRGIFNTTYFNSYESYEESASGTAQGTIDSHFSNIEDLRLDSKQLRPGYDYSHLDKYGLIKENTPMTDKTVLIGKVVNDIATPSVTVDASVYPKKGQLGYVDKAFMTEGEEGFRIAKVRLREERLPSVGDKFVSRAGQKGTCGLILREEDMPFTSQGVRPDLIINPHALPSRMTIGQLVEVLMGKANLGYGAFGDCTAFNNRGPKMEIYGKLLTNLGYHKSGNEILYNGIDGTQLESSIYIGPTYYLRLKHMVKDKINYRAKGPRTLLTRQAVQGRANDGGLRIGEMERDSLVANGMAHFVTESMMLRGDAYRVAVDNSSGLIAVYNAQKNIFLSPTVDGPLRFTKSVNDELSIHNVSKYGKTFSVLNVPYAFKLLMQELATMNVQMRIITADNIDQINSMAYSDNLNKLMHEPNEKISTLIQGLMESTRIERSRRDIEPDLGDIAITAVKAPATGALLPGEHVRFHSRYYNDMPPHEAAAYQGLWVVDSTDGDNATLRGLPVAVPVTELLRLHESEGEPVAVIPSPTTLPGAVPLMPPLPVQTPPTSLAAQAATPSILPPMQPGAYTPPGTPPVPTEAYTPPGMPPATAAASVSPPYTGAASPGSISPPYTGPLLRAQYPRLTQWESLLRAQCPRLTQWERPRLILLSGRLRKGCTELLLLHLVSCRAYGNLRLSDRLQRNRLQRSHHR